MFGQSLSEWECILQLKNVVLLCRTEKNACGWSQDKLKELLVGLRIESDVADCQLSEMEKIEGEAVANNRKGKLIFFYEWDITLSWKGRLKGGIQAAEGKIHIPNLSEENDISEVEVINSEIWKSIYLTERSAF